MKYLSIALIFLLIVFSFGCENSTSQNKPQTTEDTPEQITNTDILKVWATHGFVGPLSHEPNLQISAEQSDTIKDVWDSCVWENNVSETVYDYVFVDKEREVRYSYDEGIFNDVTNMKSTILSKEMHAKVNNVVDWLIVLPIID